MSDDFFPDTSPQDEPEPLVISSEVEKPKNHPSDDLYEESPKRAPYTPPRAYMPPSSRKSRNRLTCGCVGLIIALPLTCCSLVIACLGIFVGLGAVADKNQVTRSDTQVLEVVDDDRVNLDVSNNVGEISIRGNDVDTIQVEIDMHAKAMSTRRAEEILDNIAVDVHRDGDRYVIKVDNEQNLKFAEQSSVDLRITVPETLNVTATSNVGSLNLRDVTIRDRLNLTNDVGEITFDGTLGTDGQYEITSNVGAITVEVDKDDAFRLDATSDVGKINNKLELRDSHNAVEGVGGHLTGIYGDDDEPSAKLIVISNVGVISLQD